MLSIIVIILILAIISLVPFNYPLAGIKTSIVHREGYLLDYKATTAAKGLAMLFILIGHISGTFSTVVFSPLPSAGVTMFLILSGYGLSESFKKTRLDNFWAKKITRVLIPYGIVITAILIAKSDFTFSQWIFEITGLKTSYWYIAYQMKWYIAFFVVMALIPQRCILWLSVIGLIMFFTLEPLEVAQTLSFIIGVITSYYKDDLCELNNRNLKLIFVVTALTGIVFLGIKQMAYLRATVDSPLYSLIQMIQNVGFAISFITLFSIFPKLSDNGLLVYTGIVSYELYLLHFPFYGMTDGNILYAMILIVCSLVASGLFYVFNTRIISFFTDKITTSKH